MILEQRIDAAAIDSTVLEIELRTRPELRSRLRRLESWGPSPIPPWIIHKHISAPHRRAIRQALWQMPSTESGRHLLRQAGLRRFAAVSDRDYDPIRQMDALAQTVTFSHEPNTPPGAVAR